MSSATVLVINVTLRSLREFPALHGVATIPSRAVSCTCWDSGAHVTGRRVCIANTIYKAAQYFFPAGLQGVIEALRTCALLAFV